MKECNYLDTRREVTDEEYNDYVAEQSFDLQGIKSRDEYESDAINLEVSDFWENLKCSANRDVLVIVTGSKGLWNGRHEINPIVMKLSDAIREASSSADDLVVKSDNESIIVESHHHDGTNVYSIYPLSDKGIEEYERSEQGYIEFKEEFIDSEKIEYLY